MLKCEGCKQLVGWTIPSGETSHSLKILEIKLHEGCKRVISQGRYFYLCENCLQFSDMKYDKESTTMYTYI